MDERDRTARRTGDEHLEPESSAEDDKHRGAEAGAMIGTVSIGPLGAPFGAAAGAAVDALLPDPDAPPTHTHDLDAPCYDGCPAWVSEK